MRALSVGIVVGSCLSTASRHAHAACAGAVVEWIEVRFSTASGPSPSDSAAPLERKIVEHLRAEFGPKHIEVCTAAWSGAPPALATLHITRDAFDAAVVTARANDAVTHKELSRHLSLEGLPDDTHALAIALGASELLGASWLELRLTSPTKSPSPIPAGVERVLSSHEPSKPTPTRFGAFAAAEAFQGGIKQVGMDVQLGHDLAPWLAIAGRVGGRSALGTHAQHGTVSANGWLVGFDVDATVARLAPSARLNFQTRLDLLWIDFTAAANKDAIATSGRASTAWWSAGVGSAVRIADNVAADAAVFAGWVLLPLSATDNGVRVVGLSKGVVAAHAGITIRF